MDSENKYISRESNFAVSYNSQLMNYFFHKISKETSSFQVNYSVNELIMWGKQMFPKFHIKYCKILNLATEFHDWKKIKYFAGISFRVR